MWVMTTGGFTSAVRHRDNHDLLMVRARDRKSLENMLLSIRDGLARAGQPEQELPEIESQPVGKSWDYPHRVTVSKVLYEYYLIEEVDEYVDYSNFKNAATQGRGEAYHKALMNVWFDMRAMTEPEFKKAEYTGKYTGKYGTTYDASPWAKPATTGLYGSTKAKDPDAPIGTVYEWDDDGKVASTTPVRRSQSIHDLPLDIDPDDWANKDDNVIDVDEEGAPIHAYVTDLGPVHDEPIEPLEDTLPPGFHLVDEDEDPYEVGESFVSVDGIGEMDLTKLRAVATSITGDEGTADELIDEWVREQEARGLSREQAAL